MLKAHSDMRPGQAGRSPVSQAAAQPRDSQPTASHQLGAALLQCVRLVQLLECRVQAGTWYNRVPGQAANQGGSTMYSIPPLPTRNLLGAWQVAGPTPQLSLLAVAPASSFRLWSFLVLALGLGLGLGPGLGPGPFLPTSAPRPSPPSSPFSTVPARPHCQHFCFARLCSLLAIFQ